jgi:hypothetical protein
VELLLLLIMPADSVVVDAEKRGDESDERNDKGSDEENDYYDDYDDYVYGDQIEMKTLLSHLHLSQDSQSSEMKRRTNIHFHHLRSRFQPSRLLYIDTLLSPRSTFLALLVMLVLYISILLRYIYLRYVNQPSDIVAYLMIHILAQMGFEMWSKMSFLYQHGDKVLAYQRLQVCFGWKSIFLFFALGLVCLITVLGTIHDYHNAYTNRLLNFFFLYISCLSCSELFYYI